VNLQNIPRSDKTIKRAFRSKLDALLFFDYKQIELRLLAFYMAAVGDDSMARVFNTEDPDLHAESAIAALNLDREPDDEERQIGKTLNFSIVYGGGRPTIMRQLDLTWMEAGRLLAGFHQRWPGVALLNHRIEDTLRQRGYIKTLWGRHLHPESQHKALNALVQGCAADLMKSGMVKTHRWLHEGQYTSHLILTVHDELILDALGGEIPALVESVPELMKYQAVHEVVPILTDCEISTTTWADKESYADGRVVGAE